MEPEVTLLTSDKEIPGQKYTLLSFVSPETVLKNKDVYYFNQFLKSYEFEFKTKSIEEFLAKTVISINTNLEKKAVEFEKLDLSGSADVCRNSKVRIDTVFSDLQEFIKKNSSELHESQLKDKYDDYVALNKQKLESDFYVENKFQTSTRGLKIRGTFGYHEEAEVYARKLQKEDPVHNIFVAEVGKWLPWDPQATEVKDQEYAEEQLNTLMKKKRENEEQKETFFKDKNLKRPEKIKFSVTNENATTNENHSNDVMFNQTGDLALDRKLNPM